MKNFNEKEKEWIGNMKDYDRIAKKITLVLFLSQGLSSAGFIAAFTVNALIGVDLTGQPAMAGVPGALYVGGQACGAMVWASVWRGSAVAGVLPSDKSSG